MGTLCFIDTETTGLDPRIHQPWELCMWREDKENPWTFLLPHTLEFADSAALRINNYHERGIASLAADEGTYLRGILLSELNGVTLVGSNPAFDAAMLQRFLGTNVWHHRMIDVSNLAMGAFNWPGPMGLADVRLALEDRGHQIPEPDHTAEGDVRATRAIYEALRAEIGYLHERAWPKPKEN